MLSFLWYIHLIFFLLSLVPVSLSVLSVIFPLFLSCIGYKCVFFAQLLLHHGCYQKGRIFKHTLKEFFFFQMAFECIAKVLQFIKLAMN